MPKQIIFNDCEKQLIIDLYQSGTNCPKIGKQFNCSKQTINKLLKQNNIKIKDKSHSRQKYQIKENIFETIDSYQKAYWLGVLAGDGCLSSKSLSLSLQEKDKIYVENFRDFLNSNHPIIKTNNKNKKNGSSSISYTLNICNKKLMSDVNIHGIKINKTYHMDFPNFSSKELLANYMLGLIDSDGCFCIKKQNNSLSFSFVGPTEFVKTFQNILINELKISKTKLYENKKTNFIAIVNYNGYKNIFKIVKFLYSNSPQYMIRKKKIAIDYLLTKYPNDEWLKLHSQYSSGFEKS